MFSLMANRKEKQRGVIKELSYLYPKKAGKGLDRLKRESENIRDENVVL